MSRFKFTKGTLTGINVSFGEDIYADLLKVATEQDVPLAVVVRAMVSVGLEEYYKEQITNEML